MPTSFFADVADALAGFLPPEMRDFEHRLTSRNLKVWFGEQNREHYEVQLVPASALKHAGLRARGPALEVGFHAEHREAERNEEVLRRLRKRERTLRKRIGADLEIGPFVGRPSPWRRASELWHDGDITAPEAAIEAAETLARYIQAIEPARAKP